jgi:hypothetical protein
MTARTENQMRSIEGLKEEKYVFINWQWEIPFPQSSSY